VWPHSPLSTVDRSGRSMGALATPTSHNVSSAAAAQERQEGVELAGLVAIGERVEEIVAHHLEPWAALLFPLASVALRRGGEVGEREVVRRGRR
jgi:hypothetical protein